MEEEKIDPGHQAVRGVLRVVGPVLLGIGGLCMVVGFIDFFGAMHSFGSPRLFFLFFIGMPLLFAGGVMTKAGFMGRIARYHAGEAAPVAKDTIHYMAEGTQGDVQAMARAAGAGLREGLGGAIQPETGEAGVRCHKCNFVETADAKFCSACGAAMAKSKTCPECGELNDPDARFCDACGKGF